MKEIAKVEITMIDDRGFKRFRVNFIKNNSIFGFMRTI
jgi:hypothetical protein